MKLTKIATSAFALSLATAAVQADVSVEITGATAFRQAALNTIKARFDASGQPYRYAHDQAAGQFNLSTRSIWKGTFPGISGVTTIRCSFNGSVEGINALVNSPSADPTYYTDIPGNLVTAAAIGGGETHTTTPGFLKTTAGAQSDISFSDVSSAVTPYAAAPLVTPTGGSAVGVVVFTMIANEGSPLENITSQQFRALFSNGFQPLSLFTGVAADDPEADTPSSNAQYIFATGRNDGSGTRTTYLAETGYGVTELVNQYLVTSSTGDVINTIRLVPAANGANASTVWGQDVNGNGGYSSGSNLRADLARESTSTNVLDASNVNAFGGPIKLSLVSWLSLGDAVSSRGTVAGEGGKFLAFNGVKLDTMASVTSNSNINHATNAADKEKVTSGAYTAWSYQQLYLRAGLSSGDEFTVANALKTNLNVPANLGSAGITIGEMVAGRETDGGTVSP